jgi:hypothetical protein
MIAPTSATAGKIFERSVFSDRRAAATSDPVNQMPFQGVSSGYSGSGTISNAPLPTLALNRVYVLTTSGTCSASESVINALRGIDVQVNVIGAQTCGKPYGFTPVPNCGTTYFSIEFKGVNNKGFGDFTDGFAPTCQVSDDLTRPVGDESEGLLAAALTYRATQACPVSTTSRARVVPMEIVRPQVKEISIMTTPGAPPR